MLLFILSHLKDDLSVDIDIYVSYQTGPGKTADIDHATHDYKLVSTKFKHAAN